MMIILLYSRPRQMTTLANQSTLYPYIGKTRPECVTTLNMTLAHCSVIYQCANSCLLVRRSRRVLISICFNLLLLSSLEIRRLLRYVGSVPVVNSHASAILTWRASNCWASGDDRAKHPLRWVSTSYFSIFEQLHSTRKYTTTQSLILKR